MKRASKILAVVCVALLAFPAFLMLAAVWPRDGAADQGSLCMPTSGTVTGLAFSQNVNAALQAIVTSNSGATAPVNPCSGVPQAGQFWMDTAGSLPVLKLYDGTAWESLGTLDTGTNAWTPQIGGGATSLASATTTDLWSVPQSYITITGTTTITALADSATAVLGTRKDVVFAGALTLTYDATQMILPGGLSITTAAGDRAEVVSLGSDNVAIINYTRASGRPLQMVPTGHVDQFLLAACPSSWIAPNGGTIGNASSSSTIRANADTADLFAAMWALDATVTPIYTSAGVLTTRGASAADDFASNRRITVPDMRAEFLRGLDGGRGVDSGRLLGSAQADALESHSHTASGTFTGNALGTHAHTTTISLQSRYGANSGGAQVAWSGGDSVNGTPFGIFSTSSDSAGTPSGTVGVTVDAAGSTETRPTNVAVLTCLKL